MPPTPNARFVRDVTIPDDTGLPAGTVFVKTWLVENTGDVPWDAGFTLHHASGTPMTARTSVPLPACAPGEQVSISVEMTAPLDTGTYFSDWRCRDAQGRAFGEIIFVRIRATSPAAEGAGTNDCLYLDDITIPDDAPIFAGSDFVKTWRVRNTGTLPWGPGYTLNFAQGAPMRDTRNIPLPVCNPGAEMDISLTLTAPTAPGRHFSDWFMRDAANRRFGVLLWMRITVPGPGGEVIRPPKPDIEVIAPHFSQRDARWRRHLLGHTGSPVSIGTWGCLLTCFAMLASSFGHDTDPPRLNEQLLARGGFLQNYLVSWSALQTVYGDLIFDGKDNEGPTMISHIDASLDARRPVPVLVDRTPQTRYNDNDQHWVLVIARNGADYWINDPIDLDPVPISLLERYGQRNDLRASILSAIFYHRAV